MSEIVRTEGVMGGQPRIDGHRISVLQLYERVVENGTDPAVVADELRIDVADIYRALTYYYDHAQEMRELHKERKQRIADSRAQSGPRPGERPPEDPPESEADVDGE